MPKLTLHHIPEFIVILIFFIPGVFAMFSGNLILTLFGFLFAFTAVMWFHSLFIKPKYHENNK